MRSELVLLHQVRMAIAEDWPVVFSPGVLDHDGKHFAVGMEGLAVVRIFTPLQRLL